MENHAGKWMKHIGMADTGSASYQDLEMIKEEERNISGKYNQRRGRSAIATRIDQQHSSIQEQYIKPTQEVINSQQVEDMYKLKAKKKNNTIFMSSSKTGGPAGSMSNPYGDGSSGTQPSHLTKGKQQENSSSHQRGKSNGYLASYTANLNKLKNEGKDPRNKNTGENVLQASTANLFSKQPATKAIRSSKTNEGSYQMHQERF